MSTSKLPLVAATALILALAAASFARAGPVERCDPSDRHAPPGRHDPSDRCRPRDRRDPLVPLLLRITRYFERNEIDGVTIDSRVVYNRTEAVRLSVVSQLLGYTEIYRVHPSRAFRDDIARHADYLVEHFDEVVSWTAFDGMLGLSLLSAYEVTHDPRHLEKAEVVVQHLEGLSYYESILNGGLMSALALAKYHLLTGDAAADLKAHEIVGSLLAYQNGDGSFPHWCPGSIDVHYTDWMTMELILLRRMMNDPLIDPMLERMHVFLEGRIAPDGTTRYEEPCGTDPDCVRYYYSIASGCGIDYDTRAWTNELGYSALLFDHFRSPTYRVVMGFLDSLETRGAIPDKWAFWPPPGDPYYVWAIADTSVVNMSVIFWSLASTLSGREDSRAAHRDWNAAEESPDAEEDSPADRAPRVKGGGARASAWRTVDRLLAAGVDPATCLDGSIPDVAGGDGGSPVRLRPSARTSLAAAAEGAAGDVTAAAAARLRIVSIVPNPAREGCEVRFTLPAPAEVSLSIYDAGGRRVRELLAARLEAGESTVRWDRHDAAGGVCPSGLYFARLRAGAEVRTARVLVLR